MKIAVQIPVKTTPSRRVPNKNFRKFGGFPLWEHTVRECMKLPGNWTIFIDTDDTSKFTLEDDFSNYPNTFFHVRNAAFSEDGSNGNHLITQFALAHPGYDIYVQRFITAPFLSATTMMDAVKLMLHEDADSVFTAVSRPMWVWFQGEAINYNPAMPDGLPRSQDAAVTVETTGMYAITKESLFRNFTRLGNRPVPYYIDDAEALDIDTEADWTRAANHLTEGVI